MGFERTAAGRGRMKALVLALAALATLWAMVAAIYVVAFLVIYGFSALGGARRAAHAAPAAAADTAAPVDAGGAAVVATVDGIPITKAAVARAYRQRLAPYLTAGPVRAPIYLKFLPLDVAAVQDLIDHQIALGEVRRLGIDVTPADVHARLATMPLFLEGGSYIGEARAVEVLAKHYAWLPREAVFEHFRLELAIERLEAFVTRGLAAQDRRQAYQAAIDRARSLARITVDDALLSQIVRETN
jgi:hypothetical protein